MTKNIPATADTKQSILDSSEVLFARNGYRGTSLRLITDRAGVNLAAVNYHFGSKKALLEEVIRRRIVPLNRVRRQRIEEVRDSALKKKKRPEIKAIMLAFIEPTLHFRQSEPGAKDFMTFIGHSFTDPDATVKNTFMKFINPLFNLLFETACEALPSLSKETVFWRLHFSIGTLLHGIHLRESIPTEMFKKKTANESPLIDLIMPYITAGMKAK